MKWSLRVAVNQNAPKNEAAGMPRHSRRKAREEGEAEVKRAAQEEKKARGTIPALFCAEPLTELIFNVRDPQSEAPTGQKSDATLSRNGPLNKRAITQSARKNMRERKKPQMVKNKVEAETPQGSAPSSGAGHREPRLSTHNDSGSEHSRTADRMPTSNVPRTDAVGPGRVRFAELERPASAAAGRTKPGPSVLKTPSRMRHGRPKSAGSSKLRKLASPQLPAPTMNISEEEILRLIAEAEDNRLDEEITTDVIGMMSPIQRERYYSRPGISSRMRMSSYRVHRLNWAHPLRLMSAPRWDSSKQPIKENDFRAAQMKALGPHRMRPRSDSVRRYLTGKAIASYQDVVGKPTISIKEMKKPWNRVTRPATFKSATSRVKGSRGKYGYGTTPQPVKGWDMGRTLDNGDVLAVKFDRNESNMKMHHRQTKREQRARMRAREIRIRSIEAQAATIADRATSLVQSRRSRRKGGVGASVGGGMLNQGKKKHRPASARKSSSRAMLGSIISHRISRNPASVANGLISGFEQDRGRWHGGEKIERHGRYAQAKKQRSKTKKM